MTSIDKLLIQGIRSFSPQNRNVIEFFKPLTLIVGTNGAGKTTIIECLKYACTGELPPNSRNGQAFIHDTKVAREREVKAQIKMLFKAVTGKCIVATRSLQLTQKANAQQCKTIESALKTYNASGDKVSQSYRCSDIDKQVPELMGVSKAVLENVIFCHQEDSNWPLDEPASLKKKFDDIFASTRYTMALEVIKKQQKQNNQMIKELRLKLQTAQVQLDHVHKLQKQLQDSRATITRGNEKMAQYDQSISGMDAEIASRKAKVDECHRLRTGIQPQLDALRQHEAQATALRADLGGEEISDADEQLVATLAHLQSEEEANAAEIARLKQLMTDQQQEKLLLAQRMQLTLEQSQRIRQTVEENAKKADARDRLVIELALRYEIAGYTVAALPLSHEKFVDELKTQLQAMRAHVTQLKDRHSADLRKITEQVELLQRNRGQIQERLAQQLARQEETEKRAAAMKAELTTLEAANTDVRQLESQVAEAEAALASTQAMFADDPTPAQIAEAENEQQQIRIQMNELSNALKHLNKQTEARSAVNLRRRNCEEKDLRLATLRPELERLLGSAPAPDALSAAWKSFAATKKQALASAIAALQEARTSASEIDGELKSVSETLKKLTTSLEEKREKLAARLQAAGIDALPDAINLNEKAIAQLKKDLNWAASLKSTYSRFEKDAQDAKECPLCHRGFGDDAELGKFRTHIHDRVANFPAALEAQRQELAEKEKLQKVLLSLRHDSEDIERMKEEAAVLQHKSQELTKSRDGRREHLASLQSAVDEAKAEEQEVAKHTTEVDLLLRDHADLQKARKELDAEETQLRKLSSDTRTIEEVSQKYQQLQTTADALVNRISELRGNREALAMELKAAQDVCHALRTRLFQAQSNIETMRRLRTAIDEGTAALAFLQTDVPLARRALAEIDTELAALEARRKEMDAAANRLSTEATARHDALFADVQQLEGVVRALATAVPAAAKELETLEKNRTQAELRTDELTKSLQASASAIEARTSKSGARQVLLRRLQATLQFRKVKAAIAELTRKIEAEVAHIGTVDVEKLTSELAAMEKTLQKKREKRAEASGAIAAVAARIREHEAELAQAHLKHAEEEHRTLTVQCKTTEMATKDLDGYYHALDKALMRYHTAKIDEINKIVKELWQQTYRGQDIDAIEIHADQGDATKTRSYNYRIVMRKGDTELDMRGRCSAGQKVLASLVLRLALAETFGLNCGILALDEPTTNLDRANVESFANALITIIEQRRHQANFQLIVITHDEEFVEKLGSDEHASHYWRVTKDANQHSLLEQRDIKDLSKK